ncbi:hypothetical protein BX616_000667 [Lobosporangium transversale]|nr:hypothetical protein BX616_000667 [Lobosporangium transversale]
MTSAPPTNDAAFPLQIQEELLNQVRYWTSQAELKEKLNQEYDLKINEQERIIDALNRQRRLREESDERQKEDQWNLELQNQELRSQNAELQSQLTKANHENAKVQRAFNAATEQVEQLKDKEEKMASQLELVKSRSEQDISSMRKHMASLQREKADLQAKNDELNAAMALKEKLAKKAAAEALALAQELEQKELEKEKTNAPLLVTSSANKALSPDEAAAAAAASAAATGVAGATAAAGAAGTGSLESPKSASLARESSFAHQQGIISDLQSKLTQEIAEKEQLISAKEELMVEKEELIKLLADREETIETMRLEGAATFEPDVLSQRSSMAFGTGVGAGAGIPSELGLLDGSETDPRDLSMTLSDDFVNANGRSSPFPSGGLFAELAQATSQSDLKSSAEYKDQEMMTESLKDWIHDVPEFKDLLDKAVEVETEKKVAERKEVERIEAERIEAEKKEAERREVERIEAEKKEAERIEAERIEAERIKANLKEYKDQEIMTEPIKNWAHDVPEFKDLLEKAIEVETEKKKAEWKELERIEAEKREAQRIEAERIEAEKKEAERIEAEKKEAERIEAEKKETERIEAEKKEAERIEVAKKEAEKKEAERIEAEKKEAERIKANSKEYKDQEIMTESIKDWIHDAPEFKDLLDKAVEAETEKKEAERKETERIETEKKEAEEKKRAEAAVAAEAGTPTIEVTKPVESVDELGTKKATETGTTITGKPGTETKQITSLLDAKALGVAAATAVAGAAGAIAAVVSGKKEGEKDVDDHIDEEEELVKEPVVRSKPTLMTDEERRHTCDLSQTINQSSAAPSPALEAPTDTSTERPSFNDDEDREFRVSFGSAFGGDPNATDTGRIQSIHMENGDIEEAGDAAAEGKDKKKSNAAAIAVNGSSKKQGDKELTSSPDTRGKDQQQSSTNEKNDKNEKRDSVVILPGSHQEPSATRPPPTTLVSVSSQTSSTYDKNSSQVMLQHLNSSTHYHHHHHHHAIIDSTGATVSGRYRGNGSSPNGSISSLSTDYNHGDLSRNGRRLSTGSNEVTPTDPTMIQLITQTMIGDYLWKFTRRRMANMMSEKSHRRYVWVHPYTKTLYWSNNNPGAEGSREQKSKSAFIVAIFQVTDETTNSSNSDLPNVSLLIETTSRNLKMKAPTREKHELWFQSISYLLSRPTTPGVNAPTDHQTWSEIQANNNNNNLRITNGHSNGTHSRSRSLSAINSSNNTNGTPVNDTVLSLRQSEKGNTPLRQKSSFTRLQSMFVRKDSNNNVNSIRSASPGSSRVGSPGLSPANGITTTAAATPTTTHATTMTESGINEIIGKVTFLDAAVRGHSLVAFVSNVSVSVQTSLQHFFKHITVDQKHLVDTTVRETTTIKAMNEILVLNRYHLSSPGANPSEES